jgi:hypothetical protein
VAFATALAALAVPVAQAANTAPQLLEQDTWLGAAPLPGAGIFDPPVVEGGWSTFAPIDDHHYWTISDRGPNGQPNVTVAGAPRVTRTFLSPDFTPTIYKVAVGDDGTLSVQARIKLHLKAGAVDPAQAWFAAHPNPALGEIAGPPNQITGLPQIATPAQGDAAGLPPTAAPTSAAPRATRTRSPPTARPSCRPTPTASTPRASRSIRATAASGWATSTDRR